MISHLSLLSKLWEFLKICLIAKDLSEKMILLLVEAFFGSDLCMGLQSEIGFIMHRFYS